MVITPKPLDLSVNEKLRVEAEKKKKWSLKVRARKAKKELQPVFISSANPKSKNKLKKQLDRLRKRNAENPSVDRERIILKLVKQLGHSEPAIEMKVAAQKAVIQARREKKRHVFDDSFYDSQAWQQLRYRAIKTYGRVCMACRRSDGQMHVDHIKPKSRFPDLALSFDNLQILCRDCNLGKGNSDCIDWRSDDTN